MKKIKWNNDWLTWEDFNAFALVFAIPQTALRVDLPFDFSWYKGQNQESINEGRTGSVDGGIYNYYKKLYASSSSYSLLLEGNGGITQVYVNNSLAGESTYPYNRFYVDLTPYLKVNEDNDILVVVKSLDLSSRYYVGGGICRDIYLLEYQDIYFVPDSFKIQTLSIENNQVRVKVEADILNNTGHLVEDILSFDNLVEDTYKIYLYPHSTYHFEKTMILNEVELWDDEHPNLYDITCCINEDKQTISTGFRLLEADSQNGLMINHRAIKLRGACIHHDQGLLGANTYEDYEYYRITKLKEAGFNAIRSAHNPASSTLLKVCDELGMYVMDEGFDIWFKMKNTHDISLFFERDYKEIIEHMVNNDFNHPSVILYSTGNEISNINSIRGYHDSYKLTSLFHKLDPSRLVTNGINGAFAAGDDLIDVASDLTNKPREFFIDGDINKFMSVVATRMNDIVVHEKVSEVLEKLEPTMDILGYNYMTARYHNDHIQYPQRMMVGTETYPKQIYANWKEIMNNPAVFGDFTWTGFDYMGEVGKYPALLNNSGDVSFLGERRPISFYRNIVFGLSNRPYICVRKLDHPRMFGPWKLTDAIADWEGEEGEILSVEVFSNAKQVELFLNDESLGIKETIEDQAFYEVPFTPGTLRAKAYYENKTTRATLTTPEALDAIETVVYEGKEFDIIEITLVDYDHNIIYKPTKLKAEGDFIAFASYHTMHPFKEKEITVTNGKALLITRNECTLEANGIQVNIYNQED